MSIEVQSVTDDVEEDVTGDGAALQEAFDQLRAIHTVETVGWAQRVAADPGRDVHTFRLAGDQYRTLERGETGWWCVGLGYGMNLAGGDLVLETFGEPVPEVVSLAEAAEQIPTFDVNGQPLAGRASLPGIRAMIRTGELYPLHRLTRPGVPGRPGRCLFLAQVSAVVAWRQQRTCLADGDVKGADRAARVAAGAEERWATIARRLPDLPGQWRGAHVPAPSPDPLPVRGAHPREQAHQALLAAHQLGWVNYRSPEQPVLIGTPDDGPLIEVDLRGLAPVQVLAWVLGFGDARGQGCKVAYRDGLG